MPGENYVPTLSDVWGLLTSFKETVGMSLDRIQSQLDEVVIRLDRMDARLVRIESWNIDRRLDDHEQRILRLEKGFAKQ